MKIRTIYFKSGDIVAIAIPMPKTPLDSLPVGQAIPVEANIIMIYRDQPKDKSGNICQVLNSKDLLQSYNIGPFMPNGAIKNRPHIDAEIVRLTGNSDVDIIDPLDFYRSIVFDGDSCRNFLKETSQKRLITIKQSTL